MTRIGLTVEVRFLRIPTEWSLQHFQVEERTVLGAVPAVSQSVRCNTVEIDGWEIRNRFLGLPRDEAAAMKFLTETGVFFAVEDLNASEATAGRQLLDGAYGARLFFGRALSLYLGDLWREQERWRNLLLRPSELKACFGGPSSSHRPADALRAAIDTKFMNELPLRIEWRGTKPIAVIETITLRELLIATTHIDLLTGAKFKVCQRPDCAIPFSVSSEHERKYCRWNCGHIESVRRQRKLLKERMRRKGGQDGKTR